jgi:hypothetical protein
MTRLSALLACGLLAATAAPAAAGGKPTVSSVPFPDGIVLPGGVFCDFDVQADSLRNTERALTFPADADGNVLQIVTGQLWIRVINLSTSDSAVLNISGPVRYVIPAGGPIEATLLGRSVPIQPGGFLVSNGRVVQLQYPDGSSEILSASGRSIDICSLLAG